MIVDNDKTITLLSKLAASDNIPHALLFTGPDDTLKKDTALKFAKWLFKDGHGEDFPNFYKRECDCPSCYQVTSAIHPDFLIIEDSPIMIKQIRDLKKKFVSSPLIASKKIAIIKNASSLNAQAANAFLKLLEEPRGSALFILIAKSKSSVLQTIASRAIEVRFIAQGADKLENFSKEASSDYLRRVQIFENGALYEKFAEAKNYNLQNKSELINILDVWLIKLHERIKGGESNHVLNIAEAGTVPASAIGREIFRIKNLVRLTNANPQILLENLFLTYHA